MSQYELFIKCAHYINTVFQVMFNIRVEKFRDTFLVFLTRNIDIMYTALYILEPTDRIIPFPSSHMKIMVIILLLLLL